MSALFGIIVGLALGLTGGGGSIFAVPLLIYGLDIAPKSAVAISLGAVAITAAVGAVEGFSRGVVEIRAALIFAVAGMIAAPLGVLIGGLVSATVVILAFAGLMLAVALHMGVQALRAPADESTVVRARVAAQATSDPGTVCHYAHDGRLRLNAPCSAALVAVGLVVGTLSGFFGVGGGFPDRRARRAYGLCAAPTADCGATAKAPARPLFDARNVVLIEHSRLLLTY